MTIVPNLDKESSSLFLPGFLIGCVVACAMNWMLLLDSAVSYGHLKNQLIQEGMAQFHPQTGEWQLILPQPQDTEMKVIHADWGTIPKPEWAKCRGELDFKYAMMLWQRGKEWRKDEERPERNSQDGSDST